MMLIGRVARLLSGASIAPRMLPVATTTVLLLPESACPTASTRALRLARRLPAAASSDVSALADIEMLRNRGAWQDWPIAIARASTTPLLPAQVRNDCRTAGRRRAGCDRGRGIAAADRRGRGGRPRSPGRPPPPRRGNPARGRPEQRQGFRN